MTKSLKIFTLLLILILSPNLSISEFSQQNAEQYLKTLVTDIGPRPMGSPSERKALKFAVNKFKSFGCDTAYLMPMDFTVKLNTNSGIAVGIKRGINQRIIVIGAHIDSEGPEIPGANDNASGVAVVLELSRILCKKSLQSTIVFALFGGEEQGLCGSRYFVDFFPEISNVDLMFQVDMADGAGHLEIAPHIYKLNAPKWLVKATVEEYYKLGYRNLSYPKHASAINYSFPNGISSDHQAFLERGIPAIALISDVSKPIHTPQDNLQNFNTIGLKRSGDLILKLIERFDSNQPDKTLEKYWLYVFGKHSVFLPNWILSLFIIISILLSIFAFLGIRRRRIVVTQAKIAQINMDTPQIIHPKFSGVKILLLTLLPVLLAYLAPELLSSMKGLKYPWFVDIELYFLLSGIFALIGISISCYLTKWLKIVKCPYYFYKRSIIILIIFI